MAPMGQTSVQVLAEMRFGRLLRLTFVAGLVEEVGGCTMSRFGLVVGNYLTCWSRASVHLFPRLSNAILVRYGAKAAEPPPIN